VTCQRNGAIRKVLLAANIHDLSHCQGRTVVLVVAPLLPVYPPAAVLASTTIIIITPHLPPLVHHSCTHASSKVLVASIPEGTQGEASRIVSNAPPATTVPRPSLSADAGAQKEGP
jgi:hypothetical protein